MSYFAGIDLHKRYLTLCVLDPIVVQHRRLTNDGLFAVLAELQGPITVAVEATLHRAWLHNRLVAQGYAVQVSDPATRANRKLLRGYAFLLRIRTRIKNRAHAYLAEINLASLAGLVPTTRSSGGKTTHGSLPRAGSPWLRWALVETTQTPKMKPGPVRAHFTRLARAKGNSKATVAAARKLCCSLFWMLTEGRTYPEWLQSRHSHPLLEVRPT